MKTNGIKIFACYTLILFLSVFGLSKAFVKAETEPEPPPAEEEPVPVETAPPADAPVPDPPEADNTWAVMLINQKNSLPISYCDNVELDVVYESSKPYHMDKRVKNYVTDMFEAAENDGIYLVMVSAYRDFPYQERNFNKSVQDRIDAGMTEEEAYEDTLKEVALPGASEHNSGLAADIMCDTMTDMSDDSFKETKEYKWLKEHCADYGFVIRYPEGKEKITGYKFEPWHYRFVGQYYAKYMTENGLCLEELFEEKNWVDDDGVSVYHLPEEQDTVTLADMNKETASEEEETGNEEELSDEAEE